MSIRDYNIADDAGISVYKLSGYGQVASSAKGKTFFVDSSNASASDSTAAGLSPKKTSKSVPFATLAYAYTQCTSGAGDVINCLPGHAETISPAGVTWDKDSVFINGIGAGVLRPRLNFAATTTAITLTGASNVFNNMYFQCVGVDALVVALGISGVDCQILNCDFLTGSSTKIPVNVIIGTVASRLRIENCTFRGVNTSTGVGAGSNLSGPVIQLVGGDGIVIRNNLIFGNFTTGKGAIYNLTTAATDLMIVGNIIDNRTADANNINIVLSSGTTGMIVNNRLGAIDSTSPISATAAAMFVSGNYFTGAVGVSASTLF